MKRYSPGRVLLVVATLFALPLWPQADDAPAPQVDLAELRQLRSQTAEGSELEDDLKARVVALYDEAIQSLLTARDHVLAATRNDRERSGVEPSIAALREELSRGDSAQRSDLPEGATVEQAEVLLARERSRLDANRSALRDVERLSEERVSSRNEIGQRLGALDQQREALGDQLRTAGQGEANTSVQQAIRKNLLARKELKLREAEMLRTQLELLDARALLLPWQIDQAQRRVADSELTVGNLRDTTQQLRRQAAMESLRDVLAQCQQASELSETLQPLATETEELAQLLWGAEGVVSRAEDATRQLTRTRRHLSDLERIVQLTRRKFEAFGYRGSVARWWPDVPEDFPPPGDVEADLRRLGERTPEVQHQLIRFEQARSEVTELARSTMHQLAADGAVLSPDIERAARDLLAIRRDLLEDLTQRYGRYSNSLIELKTVSAYFLGEIRRVERFLYDRILWVRSVPRPVIPRSDDITAALAWLTSPENWGLVFRTAGGGISRYPGLSFLMAALLSALIALRGRIRRRLATIAPWVVDPERDSFRYTLGALLYTVLLAAPVPLMFYLAHSALAGANDSVFVFATREAFYYLALVTGFFATLRHLVAPNGLARAHFDWKVLANRTTDRGFFLPALGFLPLIFIAIQLAGAGMRMGSSEQMKLYNNSLGRIAFVGAALVIGSALLRMFRPRREHDVLGSTRIWSQKIYVYVYPLVMAGAVIPAVLATFGFYLTGYLLAYQMLKTLILILGVLILGGTLRRWSDVRVRTDGPDASLERVTAQLQIRELFRFVVVVILAVGVYTIWSEALPAAQVLKRVQLWPEVVMLEDTSDDLELSPPAGAPTKTTPADGGGNPETPIAVIPGLPATAYPGAATFDDSEPPLTLWKLCQAVLAGLVAFSLVKSVPGLLELTLRRRDLLDSGARIALSTLIRYTILIMGVTVAFGFLGISWSKIQWLAAALTFGLGFGLQEIVANFVSGLILLLERPVRVGDAVTIGNLQGRVNRIQIRATTITLWDRSEMIVPNKEFITTKLINWTLSDSERRIDIPFRIAYGSDLDKVKAAVVEVAVGNPYVLKMPAPHVLLVDFNDDAIRFELRAFVDFGNGMETRDQLHTGIDRAFREQGIQFALPRLNVEVAAGSGTDPAQENQT